MANNLYKTTDGFYILADTIENAAEKYKVAKSSDAPGIAPFQTDSKVISETENANVTVLSQTGGTVYPNTITAQSFPVGCLIQFNATPAEGYTFVSWKDGSGNVLSSAQQYNHVVLAGTISIYPVFAEIPRTLTITAGVNGTVYPDYSGGQSFSKGDSIQLNAIPDSLYAFTEWQDADGVQLSTNAQYTHVMDETITIEAVFTLI